MNTTLIVMAAGMGSRFGHGIKQLAKVDRAGHIIMDYTVHDAISAGFDTIIFVIRKDIEREFREIIGDRIEKSVSHLNVKLEYVFQEMKDIPARTQKKELLISERKKPWGTGQAVLAARDCIDGPFAVVNADDYYGKESFLMMHDFLINNRVDKRLGMVGFELKNTLSENGVVTRGICEVDGRDLKNIVETSNIKKTVSGAEANGEKLKMDSIVSMNMWGASVSFMHTLQDEFDNFFNDRKNNLSDAEYLLPTVIGNLLRKQEISVEVLSSKDCWFGVTYAEDKGYVAAKVEELIKAGVYRTDLYSDL